MKFVSERSFVGAAHGCSGRCSRAPQTSSSAPRGGLKTTMSPRSGSLKRGETRSTRTRWPTWSVGSIDSLGIRNGLTRNAWIAERESERDRDDDDELDERALAVLRVLAGAAGHRRRLSGHRPASRVGDSGRGSSAASAADSSSASAGSLGVGRDVRIGLGGRIGLASASRRPGPRRRPRPRRHRPRRPSAACPARRRPRRRRPSASPRAGRLPRPGSPSSVERLHARRGPVYWRSRTRARRPTRPRR